MIRLESRVIMGWQWVFVSFSFALATLQLDQANQFEVTEAQSSTFTGNMEVSGTAYSVSCDCNPQAVQEAENIRCAPTRLILTQDREGQGASYDQVSAKFTSDPLTYVRVTRSSFMCMDGRTNQPRLYTPGGDAGEFILALLVYEDISGTLLTQQTVEQYFRQYLDCMDQEEFVMCTDDQSLSHMQRELSIEGIDLENPQTRYEDQIRGVFTEPDNVGDMHLRMMLRYPDMYAIRPEVIQYFITAYYNTLWAGDTYSTYLNLVQLAGAHNETGFVEVRSSDSCNLEQAAPVMQARSGGPSTLSLLVNHLDASSIRRAQLAQFFAERVARFRDNITAETLLNRMNHHGLFFLDVTGSYVARALPFYTATLV